MKNRPPDLIGDALIAMRPEIAQTLLVHLKRNLELAEDFAPLGADGLPQFADEASDFYGPRWALRRQPAPLWTPLRWTLSTRMRLRFGGGPRA